jgi:hypothetical protein
MIATLNPTGYHYRDDDSTLPPPPRQTAQLAHDTAHGPPQEWARIKPAWVPERLMPTRPLTDAIIEQRRKQGFFSDAYRQAVRENIAKNKRSDGD